MILKYERTLRYSFGNQNLSAFMLSCLPAFLPYHLLFRVVVCAFGNYVEIWRKEKKLEVSLIEATEERLLNWEGVYAAFWTFPIFFSAQKVRHRG